jgi:phage terminase large subunit-like protein
MDTEELNIIEYELARREKYEPLRMWKPNGAQERFIKAILEEDSRIILFTSGNWTGKSMAAIGILAAIMWPEQAEYPLLNHKLIKDWTSYGFPKRARIVTTPKELENIGSIQVEIQRWWPKGRYHSFNKGKHFPCEFKTDSGWTVDLMSYEQSVEEFEGATIPLFVFNEPPSEDIFNACLARMKFGGKVLMPMTPLTNSAWIYDRLVSKDGKEGIRVIYGSTEENCIEHGHNGVIPHKAIQNFSDSCDPDDREARLHGKFMHMAGQIYKTFSRDVHAIKIPDIRSFLEGKTIYQVVDPAIGKPLACIWAAIGPDGALTIYDEYPSFEFQGARDSNMTVGDYADLFKTKEEGRKVDIRILDRHFGNVRRTLGGLTLKQEFGERGIDFMDSYSIADISTEVETGILRVKDYLRYNKDKPVDGLNRPKLYIADTCINVLHSFERWRRDEKTGKPKEDYKDMADCVRYLCMASPEVDRPRSWEVTPAHYGVNSI